MLERLVKLHSGLDIGTGSDRAMTAVIREETAEDEMVQLESGLSGRQLDIQIILRRIVRLGELEAPVPALLRKLSRVDFDLIEVAQATWDLELATEAGLIPAGKDTDGGRAQPGGTSPGDA